MPPSFRSLLDTHRWILTEAAVVETMRRDPAIQLHPVLAHTPLIYAEPGRSLLADLYRGFIDLARTAQVPLILGTPTWRCNADRVREVGQWPQINRDAARFLQSLRAEAGDAAPPIMIAGQLSCRHDCYRPQDSLSASAAREFHRWQIEELAGGGVDLIFATTLPAIVEAEGIAKAAAETGGVPYVLSFVVDRKGRILDGHTLADAIAHLDALPCAPPLGYFVNCSYPSFLEAAELPEQTRERLLGFQANASALDHGELENSPELRAEPIADWGDRMLRLHRDLGIKILGGCCGTGLDHLRYLVERLK